MKICDEDESLTFEISFDLHAIIVGRKQVRMSSDKWKSKRRGASAMKRFTELLDRLH